MSEEVVKYIVNELVDDKTAVKVVTEGNTIKVSVASGDMGKIIGKQGRIAKAIRNVVKAVSAKHGEKMNVDFAECK